METRLALLSDQIVSDRLYVYIQANLKSLKSEGQFTCRLLAIKKCYGSAARMHELINFVTIDINAVLIFRAQRMPNEDTVADMYEHAVQVSLSAYKLCYSACMDEF